MDLGSWIGGSWILWTRGSVDRGFVDLGLVNPWIRGSVDAWIRGTSGCQGAVPFGMALFTNNKVRATENHINQLIHGLIPLIDGHESVN